MDENLTIQSSMQVMNSELDKTSYVCSQSASKRNQVNVASDYGFDPTP
jgi:hypothetical protein